MRVSGAFVYDHGWRSVCTYRADDDSVGLRKPERSCEHRLTSGLHGLLQRRDLPLLSFGTI